MRHSDRNATALVTDRLRLREFRPADAEALYRLDADPRVMRYVGDGSVGTRASVTAAMKRSIRYYGTYPGLGLWPADDRGTGAFVGWCYRQDVPEHIEQL